MSQNRPFLGQSIKHPIAVTELGRVALLNDISLVVQSIVRILQTHKGTRFFNREFGSDIRTQIFEPNDDILESLLFDFIVSSIDKWEKRVDEVGVEFSRDDNNPQLLNILIQYRIIASNEIDSFIFPFYQNLKY